MGWNPTTANGQLTADSEVFNRKMLKVMNLGVLLRDEDYIGDDTRVSGGKSNNPQRGDGFRETLELEIYGDVDSEDDPTMDPLEGWVANIAWIRANLTGRTKVGDGTRSLTLDWGGLTATQPGRIGPLTIGEVNIAGVGSSRATCDIWLPFGSFELAEAP